MDEGVDLCMWVSLLVKHVVPRVFFGRVQYKLEFVKPVRTARVKNIYFVSFKVIFLQQNSVLLINYSPLDLLNWRIFFSAFLHSGRVISKMHKHFCWQSLLKCPFKTLNSFVCLNPRVSYSQYFQNTFMSARKLWNPAHQVQCSVSQVSVFSNVCELQLK